MMGMSQTGGPQMLGYARVSTHGQSLEAQLVQLKQAGCVRIFRETASGAQTDRPALRALLRAVRSGDMVLVTRSDRLARSLFHMFDILQTITARGANYRDLSQPLLDTSTTLGRVHLALLASFAEMEREFILMRTAEGRARSTKRMGRPPKLSAEDKRRACTLLDAGWSVGDVAAQFSVDPVTVRRACPSSGSNHR